MAGLNISTGKIVKAQKTVIYGPEGIGKTTFAAQFPDPLFIDTEGSTTHLDVKRVDPAPSSWAMLMGYVNAVIADPGVCQTLVVDTADWAERLCVEHVLKKYDWQTIEAPGYGRGYREVNEEFGRLLDKLSDVVAKGVNVVVTAHARITKFEQPDELGTYDRWSLKLFDSPKSSNAAMLKEWADMVLFANYKTNVVKPDSKTGGHAKVMGGKRIIHTTHTPAWDAKNRCGLADELPLDFSSIAGCIPVRAGASAQPMPNPAPAPTPTPTTVPAAPVESAGDLISDIKKAEAELAEADAKLEAARAERKAHEAEREAKAAIPAPTPSPPVTPAPAPETSTNRGKLAALLEQAHIPLSALQGYCGEKGYTAADTPFEAYPEDFCGYLVTTFDDIKAHFPVPFN